jgi:hypothetical protein
MRIALAVLGLAFGVSAWGKQCVAQSGPHTTALVELYTSAGCAGCPLADRWLSALASRGYGRIVPLSLHVDYGSYIGSNDTRAKRESSLRQRKLSPLQRLALVYTPQVMLQGRNFRRWDTPAFDAEVANINARPARAHLELEIAAAEANAVSVRVRAELLGPEPLHDAALYLAAYESRRKDEHLVLQWEGPVPLGRAGLEVERALPLLPGASAASSGVVAFVQNRRTAEVLQTLSLATCS